MLVGKIYTTWYLKWCLLHNQRHLGQLILKDGWGKIREEGVRTFLTGKTLNWPVPRHGACGGEGQEPAGDGEEGQGT